jgi:hypothetical protein
MAVNGSTSEAPQRHPENLRDADYRGGRNERLALQAGDLLSQPASRTAITDMRPAGTVPLTYAAWTNSSGERMDASGLRLDGGLNKTGIDANQEAVLRDLTRAMGITMGDLRFKKGETVVGQATEKPGAGEKPGVGEKPLEGEKSKSPYEVAHEQYKKDVDAWWKNAMAIRHADGHVMDFPPIYNGPPNPDGSCPT